MNKDLHDIDGLFRSALYEYGETPSAEVKERLDAALNKKDAEFYKRRLIGWKRTSLLLLFLLTGFALYESGILKTDRGNIVVTGNTNSDRPGSDKKEAISNNDNNTKHPVTTRIKNKALSKKETPGNKVVSSDFLSGVFDPLPAEINIPHHPLKEISTIKIAASLADSIKENSIAKNTTAKKLMLPKPYWLITAFASYERAGYRLDSDLPTSITSIKHREMHEPSFSLGILTTYQFKKHWGLQTGLIYSQTDIGISPQKLYALQDPAGDISFKFITSSGYAYIKPGLGSPPVMGDSLITKEGKHSLKFVSVPFVLKYSVGKNKLSFSPGIGIEANFITSAKAEIEVESPSNPEIIFINKLDGAKPFYLSIVADAELRYKLNNKLSVSLRPAIRLATSPITENNEVETFPRSFGVGVGLTKKF